MAAITTARAWANNEVAYLAWDTDEKIPGCLGFEVTRVYLGTDGSVARRPDGTEDRVKCAAWVAFKGQRNPDWREQDTGVWPVQKFSWRDLTLRQKRSEMKRRPDEVRVRYEIRPVGRLAPGLEPVPPNGRERVTVYLRDADGKFVLGPDGKRVKVQLPAYEGKPRPLAYLGPPVATNDILVTSRRAPFRTTFTNGILAAQWLRNVLNADGVIERNELLEKIEDPDDPHRKYLAGDVLPLIHEVFAREGSFYLALYELEDRELEQVLADNAARIHVILANTGCDSHAVWDARNNPARTRLQALGVDLQNRMFNNSIHIGHNKFVVHVDAAGVPCAVLTGSTNWTSTGVAGQTNNAILVEDPAAAQAFLTYWQRMHDDVLPSPAPLISSGMSATRQGAAFRRANELPTVIGLNGGGEIEGWFAPNRPERTKPTPKTHPAPVPPDLREVYRRIRFARDVILFLAFYPGQRGRDCIIAEAVDIGRKDRSLIVVGAVSSPQAMPNFAGEPGDDDAAGGASGNAPATFEDQNVSIVRAARIDERTLLGDLGVEQLTANGGIGAIIHDKIVVIDPLSRDCVVVLGSHNLGFKASYSNDENMLIISGHRDLAVAYAVHVLDVYDHYRFRAVENDRRRRGKKGWSGFLEVNDRWQDPYVSGRKGSLSRYFARFEQ
jgi:phosphatidylserine/phosphatidylglycerophosphate/cardiolipin synthase-like enzyme